MVLYIRLHFPFTGPGKQWIQIPCYSLFVPASISCPLQTLIVCGAIFIQVICRCYKWGKSLGVLICWALTIQDYLFKGGRRGLAAWLVDINRHLLVQILWKTLLLSRRLSYLCTDEGCKSEQGLMSFAKFALECEVGEKWRKKKGKGVRHLE